MAFTLATDDIHDCIDLATFVDYMRAHVDPRDPDSFAAAGPLFKRLLNNPTLVTQRFNEELLRSPETFQSTNTFLSPVFVLANTEDFLLRIVIWMPIHEYEDPRLSDSAVFAGAIAHDHNFGLMTGGYWGVGYETSVYEWDGPPRDGAVGDPVDIRFLENTTLPKGKVMLYRESRDIHIQGLSENFSISLNFIVKSTPQSLDQYYFDIEKSTSISLVESATPSTCNLCDIAAMVADDRTLHALEVLTVKHANPSTRLSAYTALARTNVFPLNELEGLAARETDPRFRMQMRKAIDVLP
jgi:hypothetical protein